jgi:hypothetical protein
MKKLAWILLLNLLILGTIGNCFASTYIESINGDLEYQNIGNLDLGLNIIRGIAFSNTEGDYSENPIFDQDVFQFNIPSGMQLTGIKFELSTDYSSNVGYPSANWVYEMHAPPYFENMKYLLSTSILGDGSTGDISISPVGEGEYYMGQGFSITTGDKFTTSYTLSLTTATVPVPGALWLLGSGLIGLVGFRKRLKTA